MLDFRLLGVKDAWDVRSPKSLYFESLHQEISKSL